MAVGDCGFRKAPPSARGAVRQRMERGSELRHALEVVDPVALRVLEGDSFGRGGVISRYPLHAFLRGEVEMPATHAPVGIHGLRLAAFKRDSDLEGARYIRDRVGGADFFVLPDADHLIGLIGPQIWRGNEKHGENAEEKMENVVDRNLLFHGGLGLGIGTGE